MINIIHDKFLAVKSHCLLPTAYCLLVFYCLLPTSLKSQSENALTRSGNKDFNNKKYADAEVNYRKALEKKNNMPEAVFNLGNAVYQQKRFEEAAKQYQLSAQTNPDPIVKAKAYHNLGNTYMAEQKYEDAIKAYKQSLKANPKDADTKYNLAYANAMLQQQQQQQQDNKDNKDDKQNQDKKENQDKQQQDNKDKNNEQKDEKEQQDKGDKQEEKKQQGQQPKLSKAEAEKLLQALQNEEQKANQKMQKANTKAVDGKLQKDW